MDKNSIYLPRVIIDSHCHGRGLRESYKTKIKKVLEEAWMSRINITAFMPNTNPPIISIPALNYYIGKIYSAERELGITSNQYVWFGVTDDNSDICDLALSDSHVIGLKIYPKARGKTVTTGTIGVEKDETIIQAMRIARKHNKPIAFHCDDPDIIAKEGNTIRAEVEYVRKIISLAKLVPGVKIVFCHLSCADSVEEVLKARRDYKIIASIEVMPHYLWFTSERHNWNPNLDPVFYHCFNNLRTLEHREYLRKFVTKGYDFAWIASDNACHTREEKLLKKLGGIPSNQEMVAVVCTLAKEMGISDDKVAGLLSFNAAKNLGIRIPYELVKYKLEEKIDDLVYNNDIAENPWRGLSFLFPVTME